MAMRCKSPRVSFKVPFIACVRHQGSWVDQPYLQYRYEATEAGTVTTESERSIYMTEGCLHIKTTSKIFTKYRQNIILSGG